MLRIYTRVAGVVLTVLGLAGLLGMWGSHPARAVAYFFASAVFLFVGFGRWRGEEIRGFVGGLGVLYALIGGFTVGALYVFGGDLPVYDPLSEEGLMLALIGLLSTTCAAFLPCEEDPRRTLRCLFRRPKEGYSALVAKEDEPHEYK